VRQHLEEEAREAEELRDALVLSEVLVQQANVERAQRRVSVEPPEGEGVTTLRFRMPGGGKALRRRFHLDDTVQMLFDYVRVALAERDDDVVNFAIERSYPRRTFEAPVGGEVQPTLRELGLSDAALFVRDLDA
jgi:hypothetical protein|tara:strand:- start:2 stop:403 length:402 start_codon:yes stop_codon:yes gene_type:complete